MPETKPVANQGNGFVSIAAFISVAGIAAVTLLLLAGMLRMAPMRLWLVLSVLMAVLLIAIGQGANGRWYGVLIDVRNRVSLSRLQISLWTVLAVSAYLAISLSRGVPDAMKKPTAEEIVQCRAGYLRDSEGIQDIEAMRLQNPEAAAAALERAKDHCSPQPLQITFPPELLLALGISTASFAGSTLVQSMKRNKRAIGLVTELKKRMDEEEKMVKAKGEAFNQIQKQLAEMTASKAEASRRKAQPGRQAEDLQADQSEIDKADLQISKLAPQFAQAKADFEAARQEWEKTRSEWETEDRKKEGLLKVNESPQQANLSDLFQGDEIGNYQLIDLSKVQMFFFTIAVLASYGVALAGLISNTAAILHPFGVDLPAFSATLNTLLGISHAGYLAVKSVDHTKTE